MANISTTETQVMIRILVAYRNLGIVLSLPRSLIRRDDGKCDETRAVRGGRQWGRSPIEDISEFVIWGNPP